jgi:hypothetical protein
MAELVHCDQHTDHQNVRENLEQPAKQSLSP